MPEMNSRHSKTSKILLHRPIYRLNLVIFGFLRYDLCLPITDFSVITAISLLFLCYICYGFSVMDRSRLSGCELTTTVFFLFSFCFLTVFLTVFWQFFWLFSDCFLTVFLTDFRLFSDCFLTVFLLFSDCFLTVFWLLPELGTLGFQFSCRISDVEDCFRRISGWMRVGRWRVVRRLRDEIKKECK
jgi:hypothetical protein